MHRTDFIKAAARRAGVTYDAAATVIAAALDVAGDAIKAGGEVKLQGFGTLKVKRRRMHGRNMQTGEALTPRDHAFVHFEAARCLKAAINAQERA